MTWFKFILLVMMCISVTHQARAATTLVRNAGELSAALASASAGDTFRLAPGNYGALSVNNRVFTNYVTLESSNKSNPAVFSHIEIEASNYLRIDTVKVVAESREGVGVFASSNVQILNAWIHGKNQFNRQAPVLSLIHI